MSLSTYELKCIGALFLMCESLSWMIYIIHYDLHILKEWCMKNHGFWDCLSILFSVNRTSLNHLIDGQTISKPHWLSSTTWEFVFGSSTGMIQTLERAPVVTHKSYKLFVWFVYKKIVIHVYFTVSWLTLGWYFSYILFEHQMWCVIFPTFLLFLAVNFILKTEIYEQNTKLG